MNNVTRREFLKLSLTGTSALLTAPLLNSCSLLKSTNENPMANDYFVKNWGLDKTIFDEVIRAALSRGATYADIFFQHKIETYIVLKDQKVDRAYVDLVLGAGVRAQMGDATGFAFTEDITKKSLIEAAQNAALLSNGTPHSVNIQKYITPKKRHYTKVKTFLTEIEISDKIKILRDLDSKIRLLDKTVEKVSCVLNDEINRTLLVNSLGQIQNSLMPKSGIGCNVVCNRKGKREKMWDSIGGRVGAEFFTDKSIDKLARKTLKYVDKMFLSKDAPSGEFPLVMAPGGSGIFLHEAIGHGMEADFNRKGVSLFSGKLNKKITNSDVTIVDSPKPENLDGTINTDDEGVTPSETILVKNGVLKGYLHDRMSARHFKVEPTGNGRRQSYQDVAIPRMRNTFMLPGKADKESIIRSVKKGVYAEKFTNGQVNISNGDYTFYIKSGHMIENGRITHPIKDVNIIGNGFDSLSKITMVGDDLKFASGGFSACGKAGQSVPVSYGVPHVKISSVTVGGKKS